jgi:capsule polysaccharide export protein KpsC/LpsZ
MQATAAILRPGPMPIPRLTPLLRGESGIAGQLVRRRKPIHIADTDSSSATKTVLTPRMVYRCMSIITTSRSNCFTACRTRRSRSAWYPFTSPWGWRRGHLTGPRRRRWLQLAPLNETGLLAERYPIEQTMLWFTPAYKIL